jgi:hypothetical protein
VLFALPRQTSFPTFFASGGANSKTIDPAFTESRQLSRYSSLQGLRGVCGPARTFAAALCHVSAEHAHANVTTDAQNPVQKYFIENTNALS